jgi:hypothetical protein
MSKSTPLSQLSQNQAQGPSEEEKESLLVNEILNEINKDEEGDNVSMNVEQAPIQEAPVQAPQLQPEVQPIPPSENSPMEANESPDEEAARRMFKVDMEQPEETTMIQEFLNNLKAPIIVGALVVLFSIPQVSTTLGSLIPPREILQKFKLPVVLLMKFILSAVVYFAINMAL